MHRLFRLFGPTAAIVVVVASASAGRTNAATLPFTPAAKQGLFLHVSDIHFNPFADKALIPALIAAPVAQWARIFQTSRSTPFPRRGHADTTYPLLVSMLAAAKGVTDGNRKGLRYDYVLNTGDNLAHDFRKVFLESGGQESGYHRFVVKTLQFVNRMLRESFPGTPLIYALGNNDAVCGDYKVAQHSKMLAQVAGDLPIVAHDGQARRDFAAGGFYAVPHPRVPRHDIIVLNSVFWSIKYKDECDKSGGDPGVAELDWLKRTLAREKATGRTGSLVMHIPPGINSYTSSQQQCPQPGTGFWRDDVTSRFQTLAAQYRSVLRASYAGHTHMDGFRLLSKDGTPLLATRITPALSPVFGNNPAFSVLLYDRANAIVADSAIFYLTNLDTAGPDVPAKWAFEYSFAQTYGVTGYTAENVAALARRIAQGSPAAQSYMKFYPVEAPTPVNRANLIAYACAQTALTAAAYADCRCTAPQRSK